MARSTSRLAPEQANPGSLARWTFHLTGGAGDVRWLDRSTSQRRTAGSRARLDELTSPTSSIVGGTIVDGTGAPGRPGTVVIEGERLRLIPAGAEPPSAARTIDATGRGRRPGLHRPAQPRRPRHPRRPAPRAQGPPGHHDRGRRRRRHQLRAVPAARGPRRVRRDGRRPRRRSADRPRLGLGRRAYLAATTARSASTSPR